MKMTVEKYEKDLDIYIKRVQERYGTCSKSAERETIALADTGNTAAMKMYADLIFYKKIYRKMPYREAFSLYMKAAALSVGEDKLWHMRGDGYPLAWYNVASYLFSYRRDSYLKDCEEIALLEQMTLVQRLRMAIRLSVACIEALEAPAAVNLAGRILKLLAENEDMRAALSDVLAECLENRCQRNLAIEIYECRTAEECRAAARQFFRAAAREGYTYAGNSLALEEAEIILSLAGEAKGEGDTTHAPAGEARGEDTTSAPAGEARGEDTTHAPAGEARGEDTTSAAAETVREAGSGEEPYGASFSEESAGQEEKRSEELAAHIRQYVDYLRISADRYEPYAANRLGLFYMTGEIISGGRKAVFREYCDRDLAKTYFKKATVYPDANSAWAFYNLIQYFPRDYEKNIDLLDEHFAFMRELNPEVYAIAMDQ